MTETTKPVVTQVDVARAIEVFAGQRPSMLEIDRVSKLFAAHREAYSPSEPSVVSQDLVPDMFASGFMAAWVKMVADNGKAPFPLTDAEIDDAWRVWLEATNGR